MVMMTVVVVAERKVELCKSVRNRAIKNAVEQKSRQFFEATELASANLVSNRKQPPSAGLDAERVWKTSEDAAKRSLTSRESAKFSAK